MKVLPLFKEYKIVVLGDREFCSVTLANCSVARRRTLFTSEKSEFVQVEGEIWQEYIIGLTPGVSFTFRGKSTKQKSLLAST